MKEMLHTNQILRLCILTVITLHAYNPKPYPCAQELLEKQQKRVEEQERRALEQEKLKIQNEAARMVGVGEAGWSKGDLI